MSGHLSCGRFLLSRHCASGNNDTRMSSRPVHFCAVDASIDSLNYAGNLAPSHSVGGLQHGSILKHAVTWAILDSGIAICAKTGRPTLNSN